MTSRTSFPEKSPIILVLEYILSFHHESKKNDLSKNSNNVEGVFPFPFILQCFRVLGFS